MLRRVCTRRVRLDEFVLGELALCESGTHRFIIEICSYENRIWSYFLQNFQTHMLEKAQARGEKLWYEVDQPQISNCVEILACQGALGLG